MNKVLLKIGFSGFLVAGGIRTIGGDYDNLLIYWGIMALTVSVLILGEK